MNSRSQYSIHLRNAFSDEKKIRADLNTSMLFRYGLSVFSMLFLFVFRKRLPFPFPGFLLVSFGFLLWNNIIHLVSFKKGMLKKIYPLVPYSDTLVAPFVFQFSGGFLSPFVITHVVTTLGSYLMYTSANKIPRNSAIILGVSYLSIALAQKFGILPCSVSYAAAMMSNNFFFFFIVSLTTSVIVSCLFLVEMLNVQAMQMLDNITHSFDSVLKGTISAVGQDLFVRLTQYLSQSLSARCVMIAEIADKGRSINALAVWKDGKVDENFESPIDGTVFAEALSRQKCVIEENTDAFFRANPLLAQCKAAFFFGLALVDSAGKPIGILCVVNDGPMENMYLVEPLASIFASRAASELERKNNEDQRKSVELQLAQAHKMAAIGQLAGGIAHDFNNMISAMSGYAHLIQSKLDAASPLQKYLKNIISAGSRTSELVGQLSHFTRRGPTNPNSLNVHELVDETMVFLERTIGSSISLAKCLEAKNPLVIGDATLLQNALLNLGINARDALEDKNGEILFSTADAVLEEGCALCQSFNIEHGPYVAISVTNTGCGMNSEVLGHMFEPFFTTKPKGKGTGLGLANVWGYVENFKGAIEVKSAEGKGTTFTIFLPEAKAPSSKSVPIINATPAQPYSA